MVDAQKRFICYNCLGSYRFASEALLCCGTDVVEYTCGKCRRNRSTLERATVCCAES